MVAVASLAAVALIAMVAASTSWASPVAFSLEQKVVKATKVARLFV